MRNPYHPPAIGVAHDVGALASVHHRGRAAVAFAVGFTVLFVLAFLSTIVVLGLPSALALLALVMVGLGAALVAHGQAGLVRAVELHEEGLVVDRWLTTSSVVRFDDVTALHRSLDVKTTMFGTGVVGGRVVLVAGGARVTVPGGLEDAETLFAVLERRLVFPVRREARRAFAEGETLAFGPLTLDRDELTLKSETVPWGAVEKVGVSPKLIQFHVRGRWRPWTLSFAELPYPFVLVDLVQQAGRAIEGFEGFVTRDRS